MEIEKEKTRREMIKKNKKQTDHDGGGDLY